MLPLCYAAPLKIHLLQCSSYCPGAKYDIKVDDDVIVDWNQLMNSLDSIQGPEKQVDQSAVWCPSVMRNMRFWRPKAINQNEGIVTVMSKW